jgi:hypothetical protein
MSGWESFFIAQVGASAALAGFVFVAVSINLTKIMSSPRLPGRAFEPLVLLLALLIVSSLTLVPDQSTAVIGIEVLVVGVVSWLTIGVLLVESLPDLKSQYRLYYVQRVALDQLATLPVIACGLALLTQGASGLIWMVPCTVFCYLVVFLDAWVLLVEINR